MTTFLKHNSFLKEPSRGRSHGPSSIHTALLSKCLVGFVPNCISDPCAGYLSQDWYGKPELHVPLRASSGSDRQVTAHGSMKGKSGIKSNLKSTAKIDIPAP